MPSFITFAGWFVLPLGIIAVVLLCRRDWPGRVYWGLMAGASVPFFLVAALNWSDWQHRTPANDYPNPYVWGGFGLGLLLGSAVAFWLRRHR